MKLCAFADEASEALSGQIAALVRNKIPYLEIRGVDGRNVKDVSASQAKEIAGRLADGGIRVWSVGSPIGKIALDGDIDGHLDDFKRILETADILGASRIRLFSFFPVKGMEGERVESLVFEYMSRLLSLAPDGIYLCHENEKEIYGENVSACLRLHEQFPRLRAVFDPANFVQCGVDTWDAWQKLRGYVDYLHIKDAAEDGTVVPAGRGIGNVPEIVADYLSRGGEVMTVEPHLQDFTGLSALENGASVRFGLSAYRDNDESFDAAVNALKSIIRKGGYEI